MGPALDGGAGPDVVRPLRPQTEARPVVQPEPALPGLLSGNLQLRGEKAPPEPFVILLSPSPDPLDAPGLHDPGRDAPVPAAPVRAGKRDNVCGQRVLVGLSARRFPFALLDAVQARDRRRALRRRASPAHDPRRHGGGRGSDVSQGLRPSLTLQDRLLERQVRHRLPQALPRRGA